jgi:hypothetical protein
MKILTISDNKFLLPGRWNELTADQVEALARLSVYEFTEAEIKLRLLMHCLKCRVQQKPFVKIQNIEHYYVKINKQNAFLISALDLAFASSCFDFLFEQGYKGAFISSKLSVNHFPVLKIKRKSLYGPANLLRNCIFAEWMVTETHYANYLKTKDEKHFSKLIATLYRPAKRNATEAEIATDARETFHDALIEKRAKLIAHIKPWQRVAVMMFYSGVRDNFARMFPNLFDTQQTGKADKTDTFSYMTRINDMLAGEDVTKKEAVRQTNLIDILINLEEKVKANKKIEKEFKK